MVAKKKLNDHLMVADDDKENDILVYEEEAPLGDNNILQ